MTVLHQESAQFEQAFTTKPTVRLSPSEFGGPIEFAFFSHTQDGAGDALSTVALVKLPPGRVRLLTGLSRARIDWTTGSATLDLGWREYVGKDGVAVAESKAGLISALDVETAGMFSLESDVTAVLADGGTKEFVSRDGVVLIAHSPTVAIASGSTIAGYVAFVRGHAG